MLTAIGVISGTSMDGIDVAVVRTDGEHRVEPGAGRTYPYPEKLRAGLFELLKLTEMAEHDSLEEVERAVTDAHIAAVQNFMTDESIAAADVVGMHGQTILHRPERRFTRQLLDGARAALALKATVVNRFRHADVAAGGQGAPFVPLYHAALARDLVQPLMVLNLGGVANVTYIHGDTIVAFDTGPASALIDDFVQRRYGQPFDDGGHIAASGRVDEATLARLMDNPFFAAAPPKSLDRNDFHARAKIVESLAPADAVATLTAFTVHATVAALRHVSAAPVRWLVTGGGRINKAIMGGLRAALHVPVEPVETVGWNGDVLEAQCFGYLAVRSLHGLPLSLPSTTGVPRPLSGGEIWRP